MKALAYYIINLLSWILAIIPLRIQYFFSDILYLLVYYVVAYRKQVVFDNLSNSFPDKSQHEINLTAKAFYRHFCDLFVEINAARRFSEKEMRQRVRYSNPELIEKLYQNNKSITLVMGHYGNWEWFLGLQLFVKHKVLAIYKPLTDAFSDEFMKKTRSRFGVEPVPMAQIYRKLVSLNNQNIPSLTMFIADQSPSRSQIKFWAEFLNQPAPVFLGTEKIAQKLDQAIVIAHMSKLKRGHYEVCFELLFEDTKDVMGKEITLAHMKSLENHIKKKPEYWLWSHRRWKHKPPKTQIK